MVEFLPAPRTLLTGLAMVESARWHEGRLWFAHWGVGEVIAVDLDGNAEVMAGGPPQMGWAIDWLPDGRLVTTGPAVTRQEVDGSLVTHCEKGGNEIVVDPRGHLYVDGADFDFAGGARAETRLDQPGLAGRDLPSGGRRHPVPQRHGGHPGRFHAGDR